MATVVSCSLQASTRPHFHVLPDHQTHRVISGLLGESDASKCALYRKAAEFLILPWKYWQPAAWVGDYHLLACQKWRVSVLCSPLHQYAAPTGLLMRGGGEVSQLSSHTVYIYLFTTFYITAHLLISAVPVCSFNLIHLFIRLLHNLDPHFFLVFFFLEGESHCQRLLCCNCCAHGNKALEPQQCRCAAPLRFPLLFYAVIKKQKTKELWSGRLITPQFCRNRKKKKKKKNWNDRDKSSSLFSLILLLEDRAANAAAAAAAAVVVAAAAE